MVGMGWFNGLSLRFATLLFALLVTLAIALHTHLNRVRTLDETTSLRSNSRFEENMGDPRVRISDIERSEGDSATISGVEFINDLTTDFLEEAKSLGQDLGEAGQFLEQLRQFRCFHCLDVSALYLKLYCTALYLYV